MKIRASEFVKRQTRTSEFSYFDGPWSTVEDLTKHCFDDHVEGYRDGVVLVPVAPIGFYSSLVKITPDIEFDTIYEARREGEEKFRKSVAYGKKVPAHNVNIVLYRKDVLEEDKDNLDDLTGADWEIVSINATPTDEEAPMTPMTMARNQLADDPIHGKGGTKANYSADDFAKSIIFWKTHTLIRERE